MRKIALKPSDPAWINCAGSVSASQGMRRPEVGRDALEGRAVHWVVEDYLKKVLSGKELELLDYNGVVKDDIVLTPDLLKIAEIYTDDVLKTIKTVDYSKCVIGVESWLDMTAIHPTESGGSVDSYLYDGVNNTLYLWELKTGRTEVEAYGNLQLLQYAQGVCELLGLGYRGLSIVVRVVQPRFYKPLGPVEEWILEGAELQSVVAYLREVADRILNQGDKTLNAGKWCKYCPAKLSCKANRKAAFGFIDGAEVPYELNEIPSSAMDIELTMLQDGLNLLKQRKEAIEEELTYRIKNGESVTGFTLEPSKSSTVFTAEPDKIIKLASMFGVKAAKPLDCITYRQLIDKTPKASREALKTTLKSFTEVVKGKSKLTRSEGTLSNKVFTRET